MEASPSWSLIVHVVGNSRQIDALRKTVRFGWGVDEVQLQLSAHTPRPRFVTCTPRTLRCLEWACYVLSPLRSTRPLAMTQRCVHGAFGASLGLGSSELSSPDDLSRLGARRRLGMVGVSLPSEESTSQPGI